MSAGLQEKPLDRRPLRIVTDFNVKMSVASETGTCFFLSGGGSAGSW